jgi:hypothetical protein
LKKDYKEVTLGSRTPNLVFDDNQPKGKWNANSRWKNQ